jgi:hypothetical protein
MTLQPPLAQVGCPLEVARALLAPSPVHPVCSPGPALTVPFTL